MYIVDFFKRLGRKSNIPVIIYLVLNVFVIGAIIQFLFGAEGEMPFILALFIGLVLYLISITIALSPVGEWFFRLQTGCKKIKNEEHRARLEPIFQEVYARAKEKDPSISDSVKLFINHDLSVNAFATGRKTVCVTEGLLSLPDETIKAVLGHEFGHLAHKDTDLTLIVTVGNFIITTIITIIKFFIIVFETVCSFFEDGWAGVLGSFLSLLFVDAFMWVWSKIGILLVMKSSRSNEFEADEFSFHLGYGAALMDFFGSSHDFPKQKGVFACLADSHPSDEKRVERLQALTEQYGVSGTAALQPAVNEYQPEISVYSEQPVVNTYSQAAFAETNAYVPQPGVLSAGSRPQPVAATGFAAAAPAPGQAPAPCFCSGCGSKLKEGAKFCVMCGTRV